MINKIAFYVTAVPGEMATFICDATDSTGGEFRVSLIGQSKYMFFPALLMTGVISIPHRDASASVIAVKVKNQLEEKMAESGLQWDIVKDDEKEIALLIVEPNS